jgi:type I restriction enzyme, S subunit
MKAIYDTPLPDGWSEEPLGKVVLTRRGYTWEKADEVDRAEADTVPVIRIPNVQDTLDLADLIHLRNVSQVAIEKAAVTKDWLLFVGSNGTQDRIGDSVLIEEDRPMVFASFLMGIQPKDQDRLRSDFFAHWMRLHLVHEIFSKTSQQTTGLANFSWGAVKKLPVRFPTCVDEQHRIADALKLADDAIQKARAELNAAQDLKRSLEAGLLTGQLDKRGRAKVKTKAGTYPQGWTVLPLKSLAVIGSGVTLNQDRAAKENACRYLTVAHVQRGSVSSDDPRYLELSEEERKTRLLEAGDILVVEGHANSMEIGRAAIFEDTGIETTFQNHLFRVRSDVNLIQPKFLLHILNSERVQRYWNAVCNTSSGLNTINRRNLRNVLIPHPDTHEQQEVVDALDAAEQNVARLAIREQALYELKRSLLQNLLTGNIRIPEGAIHA